MRFDQLIAQEHLQLMGIPMWSEYSHDLPFPTFDSAKVKLTDTSLKRLAGNVSWLACKSFGLLWLLLLFGWRCGNGNAQNVRLVATLRTLPGYALSCRWLDMVRGAAVVQVGWSCPAVLAVPCSRSCQFCAKMQPLMQCEQRQQQQNYVYIHIYLYMNLNIHSQCWVSAPCVDSLLINML